MSSCPKEFSSPGDSTSGPNAARQSAQKISPFILKYKPHTQPYISFASSAAFSSSSSRVVTSSLSRDAPLSIF
ncbi:unnamed protein product [Cuscuta campestris]|uniref:Uncharacterized protein n=1 Tax=Cuscuta campestris TaxID=132261 RepID=A0A484KL38_9ASTE|nr:unnamed protein product [Cuscuta campestris]